MGDRQIRCGEFCKRISDIVEAKANKNMFAHDITLSQMKILCCLDMMPGKSAPLKELEKFFGTSQATIAGLAARLEKKGLIDGYMDAEDRRIKHIRLSAHGEAVCNDARCEIEACESWLVEALTSEEQAELQRPLQKVYEHAR